ncbi:adenosine deaminase [Mangrovimicrobium sediminis]|uniref:Adenine deaminase n=1 Tax=Mangrovimicrobium sediminis TaxID=2562682 RepID=A0A4Z0M4K0_9GAMM|nr:adenosine deaminase [Haliea sp. SAOS-164]TGD74613.1 adenosine deaminase [Haliea sp. SAOS-164]
MNDDTFARWLCAMPKAELHLHIDGSLQPERLLQLARKNGVSLPYTSIEAVEAAYDFADLQSFLDLYYLGASVLREEEDFYHLMMDYLLRCKAQNIVHAEIMVEPQTYAAQGVAMATIMAGFRRAIDEARAGWGQSVLLILSLLRHLPEDDALATLAAADAFREDFVAIGLASSERDFPPEGFARLYAAAREREYALTAHAGEEGPAANLRTALDLLGVQRIDHGVRCVDDPALVAELARRQVPLTVCPLSNVRLCVFESMAQHNILQLLEAGVMVTVNSDDPAYFGGYLNENFLALAQHLDLGREQAKTLLHNSFAASFLPAREQQRLREQLTQACAAH